MSLHDRLAVIVLIAAGLGAVLGLVALFVPFSGIVLRIYLSLLGLAIAVQVVLGGVQYFNGNRPAQQLHYVYGAATLAAIPIALSISRRMPWPVRKYWLVAGAIVTFLLAFRAFATA